MSFGSSKSSSKPVDLTPDAFAGLQQPFADLLSGIISRGLPQNTTPNTAPMTGMENRSLARVNNAATQPSFAENILRTIAGAGANPAVPSSTQAVADANTQGVGNPVNPQAFKPATSLEAFAQNLLGAQQTQGYSADQNNPFLQGAIDAAVRPITNNLTETLDRSLPGIFTQAGQFVSPRGSSAFDRAAAIATRGATQEIGDISSELSFASFNAERDRQFQAQEAARQREAAALDAELARRGEYGESSRNRAFLGAESAAGRRQAAIEGSLGRQQEASQNAADRGVTAATQIPQIRAQEVNTMISNLQAQALPRMIQQYGLEAATEKFNANIEQLLSFLSLVGGVTRPVVANESKGKSSEFGIPL